MCFFGTEDCAAGQKVTIAKNIFGMGLVQTTLRGGDIRQEIPGKANNLLKNDPKKGDNRRVFCQFFKPISIEKQAICIFFTLWWNVVVVLREVVRVYVMPSVAGFPREIGCK